MSEASNKLLKDTGNPSEVVMSSAVRSYIRHGLELRFRGIDKESPRLFSERYREIDFENLRFEDLNDDYNKRLVTILCGTYLLSVCASILGNVIYLSYVGTTSHDQIVDSALWLYLAINLINGIYIAQNRKFFSKVVLIVDDPKIVYLAVLYVLGFVAISIGLGTGSFNFGLIVFLYICNMVTALTHSYFNICLMVYLVNECDASLNYYTKFDEDGQLRFEDKTAIQTINRNNIVRIKAAYVQLTDYIGIKSIAFVINLTYILVVVNIATSLNITSVYMYTEMYWISISTITTLGITGVFNSMIDEIEKVNDIKILGMRLKILTFGFDPVAIYSFVVFVLSLVLNVKN